MICSRDTDSVFCNFFSPKLPFIPWASIEFSERRGIMYRIHMITPTRTEPSTSISTGNTHPVIKITLKVI